MEALKNAGAVSQEQIEMVAQETIEDKEHLATAPYNFIPLPDAAVPSPIMESIKKSADRKDKYLDGFKKYVDNEGKYTGFIEYTVENLTPLFIGNKSEFFAPNGSPMIPGSTMRGLLKNMLKIISCGTMRGTENEDVTNRHLYFRDIASTCKELKDHYLDTLVDKPIQVKVKRVDKETGEESLVDGERKDSRANAGFIACINKEYVIYPADKKLIRYPCFKDDSGSDIFHLNFKLKDENGEPTKEYEYKAHTPEPDIVWDKEGAFCYSGRMINKNREKNYFYSKKGHYYYLSNIDWEHPVLVPQSVIFDYVNDKSRKGLDLLDVDKDGAARKYSGHNEPIAYGHKLDLLMPCFFMAENGFVTSFGFSKFYRIPYIKSIEEHIPEALRDEDIIDFTTAIFGRKELWGSRVFIGDAVLTTEPYYLGSTRPHNLMGPQPTSFQFYLTQSGKVRKHWDDDTPIRGYKLYWHRDLGCDGWKADRTEKKVTGTAPINPIAKASKFKGKIRFANLSMIELGAILAVLNLGKQGVFKIGKGKPIGMGSVKISYQLQVLDMDKRYESLFKNAGWSQDVLKISSVDFIRQFENYMQAEVEKADFAGKYKILMSALTTMMDWGNTALNDWKTITDYMPIGKKNDTRYKDRTILRTPQQIVNVAKNSGDKT